MKQMDKINLEGLSFYGYHGLFNSETELGQLFKIDLTLYTSTKKAGESDKMEDSIHYGEVYQTVKALVEGEPFHLLEALAEQIAKSVLADFEAVEAIMVRVNKPQAPIPGVFDNVSVEIFRER